MCRLFCIHYYLYTKTVKIRIGGVSQNTVIRHVVGETRTSQSA